MKNPSSERKNYLYGDAPGGQKRSLKGFAGEPETGEKGCAGAYRYGFNGQEKDDEIPERTVEMQQLMEMMKEMKEGIISIKDKVG